MASAHSGAAYAFVTLVTTDEYLPAALVAAHSLRLAHVHSSLLSKQDRIALGSNGDSQGESLPQLGPWHKDKSTPAPQRSNIDLVALVTPATLSVQTIRVLLTVFDRVIGVEPLGVESILAMQQLGQVKAAHDGSWEDVSRKNSDNLALLGRLDLGMSAGAALTKLHAWRLTDYQKVVYLDADVLVLKPLAHLFASPHAFAAAPDTGWPDIFNSGVMVLTPSESTFTGLVELAANTGSWDGADQGLINEYFGGEVGSGNEGQGGGWARLGFTYNTTALGGYIYAPAFRRFASKVNVAHFVGESKPWRDRSAAQTSSFPRSGLPAGSSGSESKSMASRWWDVYNSYYPAAAEDAADGDDSDLEVKITEKGVEIVERTKKVVADVPTFQAAWDSVGSKAASSSRGATIDELKAMFHGSGSQKIETGRSSEGRYESLPLFGRMDLLAPIFDFVAARKVMTPPTPTQQRRELEVSPWDATLGPPPAIAGPEGHQMRNPIDAFYTNAWDQAKDPQTEAERRRVYFNANARAQAEGRGFGYIPPEAREIHTYGHLGGDKPNEQKVKAVFPWEERSQAPSLQRRSPPPGRSSLRRDVLIQNDLSLSSTARAPPVTRRFDNYVVPSLTSAAMGDLAHGSLVSRYGNVWDAVDFSHGAPHGSQSVEALEELERQGLSSTSVGGQNGGSSTRRRTKTQESTGTRSRPTSHYVPNNYDQYAPPQPHSGQAAVAVPPSAASDCSIDDSINDEHNYPLQLGGGNGASASVGGFGEVEGSGSWASSLTDIVRLGKAAGPSGSGRGGSAASGNRRGIRQGVGLVPSRYGIEADDGDDESSTEETESIQSTTRASRDSAYSQLSPRLGTSTATSGTSPPSSSAAFSPISSSSASGEERYLVPPSSGESLGLTAAVSSLAVPGAHAHAHSHGHAREGPGYSRKSQQTEHARTTMTPRSPRTGGSAFTTNVPLPSSSPSSVSTVERGPWPYGADQTVAARNAEPTPAPLTGRARIRPEKMGGGGGDSSHA